MTDLSAAVWGEIVGFFKGGGELPSPQKKMPRINNGISSHSRRNRGQHNVRRSVCS